MPCLWFPDTVLQYWSGNYWDSLKDIILPFPFQPFFTHLHSANPSFPQKRENSGGKAWRRRDQPALQAKITGPAPDWWSLLLGMWGFYPFQFRIVLTVPPFFKERLLAISLSASLKLSFWGSSPREFCHYIKIWPSVWINRLAKVTWYDLFRSFL